MIALLLACSGPPTPTGRPPEGPTHTSSPDTPSDQVVPTSGAPLCAPGVAARIRAADYPTLSAATAASQPGDTISICPGRWHDVMEFTHDGPITIESLSGNPGDTMIDGEGTLRHIDMVGTAPKVLIRGITFTRAMHYRWAASLRVWGSNAGEAGIENCIFTAQHQSTSLVLLLALDHITIRNTIFQDNLAALGPHGPNAWLSHLEAQDSILIEDTHYIDNSSQPLFAAFAGNETAPASLTLRGVLVRGTRLVGGGSTVTLMSTGEGPYPRTVLIEDSTFMDNASDVAGQYILEGNDAALRIHVDTSPNLIDIRRTLFLANQGAGGSALHLGPWYARGATHDLILTDVSFHRGARLPYLSAEVATPAVFAHSEIPLHVTFERVDFGTGPTSNPFPQIDGCDDAITGVLDGRVLDLVDHPDRRCPWLP